MRTFLMVVVAAALTGCMTVSKHETVYEAETGSQALRLALAAGLTHPKWGPLKDVSRDSLPESLQRIPSYKLDDALATGLNFASMGIELGGTATEAMKLSVGDAGLNAGFAVMRVLMYSPTREHPAAHPQILAWAPAPPKGSGKEEREAEKRAQAEMRDMLNKAIVAAVPEEYEFAGYLENGNPRLSGPEDCEDHGVGQLCVAWAWPWLPVRVVGPDGSDAWHWRNWQPGDRKDQRRGVIEGPFVAIYQPGEPDRYFHFARDRSFLARFSAELPSWAWVYSPGTDTEPPVMLNQGKAHYFIEPLEDESLAQTHE